jgi:hypothetical protein
MCSAIDAKDENKDEAGTVCNLFHVNTPELYSSDDFLMWTHIYLFSTELVLEAKYMG